MGDKEVRIIVEVRDASNIYNDRNLYTGGVKKEVACVRFDSEALNYPTAAAGIELKLNNDASMLIKKILEEVKES